MTRRESIQTIAIAASGTLFLAGCAEADAISFFKEGHLNFNKRHLKYIGSISESILPTKHLGEKVSTPTEFIMTMINDGLKEEDIQKLAAGFDQFKLLVKESKLKIKDEKSEEILELIKSNIEKEETLDEMEFFINKIKSLSVRHLKMSQLYQEKVMQYRLVPERYEGCIPV